MVYHERVAWSGLVSAVLTISGVIAYRRGLV